MGASARAALGEAFPDLFGESIEQSLLVGVEIARGLGLQEAEYVEIVPSESEVGGGPGGPCTSPMATSADWLRLTMKCVKVQGTASVLLGIVSP